MSKEFEYSDLHSKDITKMSSGEHGSSVPNTSHHNGIPGERKSLILAEEVR